MNRTLESRIRRLEKEADMSSLRHLTDDELDRNIIGALRKLIAGHSSVMAAIEHYRGADNTDEKAIGDMLDEHLPMIWTVIARQYPASV
jgi:hypothetical protein